MGIHSEAGLNRKMVEFVKLLNIYLNHFPKHEKYALSNRIRNTAYEIYDLISEGLAGFEPMTGHSPPALTSDSLGIFSGAPNSASL